MAEGAGRHGGRGPDRATLVVAAALLGLTLLAYLPALGAGYIWDDDQYVTQNPVLRSLDGLRRIWLEPRALPQYYPLVHTSFWIEYRLWGLSPAGYHTVNVLLHAGSAVLLWTLLRGLGLPAPWLAAGLFALHPVHVESVAWVTERKNVLSGFLALLAMGRFLRGFGVGREEAEHGSGSVDEVGAATAPLPRRGACAAGAVLYVGALLAKTVTATLPVAVGLVLWWRRGRVTRTEVAWLAPLAALGMAMGVLTVWLEKYHVGAEGADWALGLGDRAVLAGRALWFYAARLVWPLDLVFVYPRWAVSGAVWWQWLFPTAAVAAGAGLWRLRGRLGRGPLAGVLLFAVTLSPALGFFDVYPFRFSFVADHFQYLASIGLLVPLATLVWRSAGRLGGATAATIVGGAWLAGLGALTFVQAGTYLDAETLWRATLARNPTAFLAHNNLGLLLMGRRDLTAAAAHFEAVIRLRPDDVEGRANLATALARQGRVAESLDVLETARRLKPDSPTIRYNLGLAHVRLGDLETAERDFREALRLRPTYADAHNNLGNVLARRGRGPEAVAHWERALQERPGLTAAAFNLARTDHALGRLDRAVARYRHVLGWRPDDAEARLGLAEALDGLGRHEEAEGERRLAARRRGGALAP